MEQYDWVRAAIRLIGVLLIGLSLPDVIIRVYMLGDTINTAGGIGQFWNVRSQSGYFLLWTVASCSQFLVGIYLLVGGKAVARLCVRTPAWMCRSCGYDLRDVKSSKCPECGGENRLEVSAHACTPASKERDLG